MRISDWSSDVCSSDLQPPDPLRCSFFNGVRTAARPDQDISMSVISKAASAAAILYGLSAANVFAQDTQVLPSIEIDSDDLPTGPVSSETLSRDRIAPLQSGTSDTTAVISRLPGVSSYSAGGFSGLRSEEHTSELTSLMRISYAVTCL